MTKVHGTPENKLWWDNWNSKLSSGEMPSNTLLELPPRYFKVYGRGWDKVEKYRTTFAEPNGGINMNEAVSIIKQFRTLGATDAELGKLTEALMVEEDSEKGKTIIAELQARLNSEIEDDFSFTDKKPPVDSKIQMPKTPEKKVLIPWDKALEATEKYAGLSYTQLMASDAPYEVKRQATDSVWDTIERERLQTIQAEAEAEAKIKNSKFQAAQIDYDAAKREWDAAGRPVAGPVYARLAKAQELRWENVK